MRVYIGGTFDAFHPGHLFLIEAGRALAGQPGDKLYVGLNSDAFVQRYKLALPTQTYAERYHMLISLRQIDAVGLNEGDEDSRPAIVRAKPDVILAGADWATPDGEHYRRQLGVNAAWLKEQGIVILFVPRVGGWASSRTRTPESSAGRSDSHVSGGTVTTAPSLRRGRDGIGSLADQA